MKPIVLSLLLISVALHAQNKISLVGEAKLRQVESAMHLMDTSVGNDQIEAIVYLESGWSDDCLSQYGVTQVLKLEDNKIIANIPLDKLRLFADSDDVCYIDFGNEYNLMMDFARPASNVAAIHDGFEFNSTTVSFTGKGVVTGLMDQGIDPNHINFTDKDGNNRVKQAYDFTTNKQATSPLTVRRFTTDDPEESHGTHVAGIMAGSYNRQGEYVSISTPNGRATSTQKGNIPYYGVATESDIIMGSGVFSDANIIKAVNAVVDYAQVNRMPAVVNLSLGSNNGPHDGSGSLESQLATLGNKAIICISAGNEGDMPMFVGKKFTDTDTELKTYILNNTSSGVDIWTNGSDPVEVSVATYSLNRPTVVASVSAAGETSIAGGSFSTSMLGSCTLQSEVNYLNNRYHVLMSGVFEPKSSSGPNVALIIKGKPGQEVYVYGYGNSSTSFTSRGQQGFTNGTTDGTINGVACGENVIAVGAYTTRTTWPTFAGAYSYNSLFVLGEISPFSSFGSNYQGVELPVISAPGAAIISSFNRYYTDRMTNTVRQSQTTASVDPASGTMVNYWGEMQGTSMSCPYVSGTIALWLEADPTLSCSEVIDILKTTAIKPSTTDELKLKQWGGGKLDALAGIKEVLRRKGESGGIDGVLADAEGYVVTPVGDRGFNVVVDGAGVVSASLYNLQGVAVARAEAQGNEVTLEADGVAPGVYVLSIETPNTARIARRILLR